MFRDINKERTIEQAMQNLKQKRAATMYVAKF
jgi:hypothetical protein